MEAATVLVADDEANIREVVRYALARDGLVVEAAADGRAALERVSRGGIALVILDVLMPEVDGLSVCRELRRRGRLPIIFLSSRTEEADRIAGLELGGDDYVTKPFSPRELSARVRSLLRRTRPAEPSLLCHGGLEVDLEAFEARVVRDHGVDTLDLTATELRLLSALLAQPRRAFNRHQLIGLIYPHDNHVSARTVDTHVRRLRSKLRRFDIDPIETVHGLGYRSR